MIFDAPALPLMEKFTAAKHYEAAMIDNLLAALKLNPRNMPEIEAALVAFEEASQAANAIWDQLQQFKVAG